MKKHLFILACTFLFLSCRVTLITGYDQVLDKAISDIKKNFNRHFAKLSRTLQDDNPNNQNFERYQDYYDDLEADLITVTDRTKFLGGRAAIVKRQVANVDSVFRKFISLHRSGLPDRPGDDRRDIRDGINSALDAVTILQESLKSSGKVK